MLSANFSAMVELGDDVLKPFLQVGDTRVEGVIWRGGELGQLDRGAWLLVVESIAVAVIQSGEPLSWGGQRWQEMPVCV